jgi:hypothetical protein
VIKKILSVDRFDDLSKASELIHDCWLDADAIVFDAPTSTLSIRYLKEVNYRSSIVSRLAFPAMEYFLRVFGVESFTVRDQQKVRFYDVDALVYDPFTKCLQIETGIPIVVRAVVTDLHVTIEHTDTIVQGPECPRGTA